jgi:hypothetical protein
MRITSSNLRELGLLAAGEAENASTVQSGKNASPQAAPQVDGYFPSNELRQLTVRATQEPEERPDIVQNVLQQMSQGAYSTVASGEQTAEAILNAIE